MKYLVTIHTLFLIPHLFFNELLDTKICINYLAGLNQQVDLQPDAI